MRVGSFRFILMVCAKTIIIKKVRYFVRFLSNVTKVQFYVMTVKFVKHITQRFHKMLFMDIGYVQGR